jgi:hypothetical protein
MHLFLSGAESVLPPPALLWSSLGVFRRPADAPLTSTARENGTLVLGYARAETRWLFRFEDELLRGTAWSDRSGRRTVELTGEAGFGVPGTAQFRDWAEFRELTLRVTDVEERTGFEPDVWVLPGGY